MQRYFRKWRYPIAAVLAAWLALIPAIPTAALDLNPDHYFTYTYDFSVSQTSIPLNQSFSLTATVHATCINNLPLEISEGTITGKVSAIHTETSTTVVLNPSYTISVTDFPKLAGESMTSSKSVSLTFPAGSPTGGYQITGQLIGAQVKAVLWFNIAQYLPVNQDIGPVTYGVASTGGGGGTIGGGTVGGGGGGGGSSGGGGSTGGSTTPTLPTPPRPPAPSTGTTQIAETLDSRGVTTAEVQAKSSDSKARLVLETQTRALDVSGNPLENISMVESTNTLTIAETQAIVSSVYDMGPDGATFEPPGSLTLDFNSNLLPEGTNRSNLKICTLNEETGQLDPILGCTVASDTDSVTGPLHHFSTFVVVAGIAPADIHMSDITVSPPEAAPGENVRVSVTLVNQGDLPGDYHFEFFVNDTKLDTRTVHLEGGETLNPEFTVSQLLEGTHTVDIGGLKASFTVSGDPNPEPPKGSGQEPDSEVSVPTSTPIIPEIPIPAPQDLGWVLWAVVGANAVLVLVFIMIFARRRR
jgi:hypothetical protein